MHNSIRERQYMYRFNTTIYNLFTRVEYFYKNNMTMINSIGFLFATYGFVRLGHNHIIKNQYKYLKNEILITKYYFNFLR